MITIGGVTYASPAEAPEVLPGRGVTAEMVRDWCRPGGHIGEPVDVDHLAELDQVDPGRALRVKRRLLVPVDRLYEVDRATDGVGRKRSTAETGSDTQRLAC